VSVTNKTVVRETVPTTFPRELVLRDRWLLWEYVEENGSTHKRPMNEKGRYVGWTDKGATMSYVEAKNAEYRADGIGIVILEEDSVVGFDFDDCRDPATGQIDSWAEEILQELGTFAEVSPSGTGVHAFAHGRKPEELKSKEFVGNGKLEVYNGHFFTVEFNQIMKYPDTVNYRGAVVPEICREYLSERGASTTVGDTRSADLPAPPDAERVYAYTNKHGQSLEEVLENDERLSNLLFEAEPDHIDRSEITRSDGSIDESRVEYRTAMSLAAHGFEEENDVIDIIRVFKTREKTSNTNYIRTTVRKAIASSTIDVFADNYIALLPDVDPVRSGSWTDTRDTGPANNKYWYQKVEETLKNQSEPFVLSAVPGMGKSTSIIKTSNGPLTVLTVRSDLYQDYADRCEDYGKSYKTLPSMMEDCPTATGEHGSSLEEKVKRLYQKDATPGEIHSYLDLPCQQNGQCPYQKSNKFDPDEYDVIIGHYRHAHRPGVTGGRTVAIDEFPSDAFIDEYSTNTVQSAVSWYLRRTEEIPFNDYEDLLTNRDSERANEARQHGPSKSSVDLRGR